MFKVGDRVRDNLSRNEGTVDRIDPNGTTSVRVLFDVGHHYWRPVHELTLIQPPVLPMGIQQQPLTLHAFQVGDKVKCKGVFNYFGEGTVTGLPTIHNCFYSVELDNRPGYISKLVQLREDELERLNPVSPTGGAYLAAAKYVVDIMFPPTDTASETPCGTDGSHAWKPYTGLTECYYYCTKCDKKKPKENA